MSKMSQSEFGLYVENIKVREDTTYLESCIIAVDELELEMEDVPALVGRALRDRLETEAIANRWLKTKPTKDLSFLM
ncbi:MAG: late promoter transcription accessory protein [Culicoidibacterales bacterium]